ncbi:hypothetical protein EC973_004020 [Apophysomyces ossiformis]|uniref:Uncharacterized protein n=1 Tax=Apophysomyces ossiformis TaxID=679940 RepID=A0A8H7BVD6_9FUNG|nr:hypothetical protein EC973_004020 [Apophysomyces ossiformis]
MTLTTSSLDIADLIRVLEEHRAQMEDNKEQYRALSKETEILRRRLLIMKQENNTFRRAHERLESQLYTQEQELAQMQKENKSLGKRKKDLEKRLENELRNYESDRLLWQQREADLCAEMKRYTQGQPRRTRSATASNIFSRSEPPMRQKWDTCAGMSPLLEDRKSSSSTPSATLDSVSARDSKIRAQDKLIQDLKAELQQQKLVTHEALMTNDSHVQRIQTLELELAEMKHVNQSLMEDNEGYQLLLREKTEAEELLKRREEGEKAPTHKSLAAELNMIAEERVSDQRLYEENRILQEANKALTVYLNKLLLKIVDNNQLVDVLNIDETTEGSDTTKESSLPNKENPTITTAETTTTTTAARPRRSTISAWISSSSSSLKQQQNANNSESGGWTRAFKRMSVMGWSGTKSASPSSPRTRSNSTYYTHDSAISSCTSGSVVDEDEEERKSSEEV